MTLRDIMEEFAVNERTARRMARALEDVFPRIDVVTDDERRRWWSLRDVDYTRHRGFRESETAALDLAIRRAERDGAANEVKSLTEMRDRLLASASPPQARSAEVSSEVMLEANGFACRPGPASQASPHYLRLLFEAFIAPMSIRMTYRSARDDAPRERVVEPYGVILGTGITLWRATRRRSGGFVSIDLTGSAKWLLRGRTSCAIRTFASTPTAHSLLDRSSLRPSTGPSAGALRPALRLSRATFGSIQTR